MNFNDVKKQLNPQQYTIACDCGTEPPFDNEYWDKHADGIYVDVVSGVPLFDSQHKYDSGSGWPSFTQPFSDNALYEKPDNSLGRQRTEVRSTVSDIHLGHVFTDGPPPLGLRYCINSASLRFIARENLVKEGYAPYVRHDGQEQALFAAGCFWGTEAYFRRIEGVLQTQCGYSGGTEKSPSYEKVCSGSTGHAETVWISFDPSRIQYGTLLRHFFRMHDPTTENRQGFDVGTQYRSAVFTLTTEQEKQARAIKKELEESLRYPRPIVTEISGAGSFYPAEEYHQEYLERNPGGYCHVDLSLARKPL